jgi:dynein heavy chain
MFPQLESDEGIPRTLKYQKLYESKHKKMATLLQGEELFGLPRTVYTQMDTMKSDLTFMSQLFTLYTTCMAAMDSYSVLTLAKLSVTLPTVQQELETFNARVQSLPYKIERFRPYLLMKERLDTLLSVIPLLQMLTNTALRSRHWQEVMVATQTVLEINSPTFCMKDLMAADLYKHKNTIQEVCVRTCVFFGGFFVFMCVCMHGA